MNAITIPIVVGADRHLVIDLPDDVPIGPANLVIMPAKAELINPERERIRAKLLAAGALVTEPVMIGEEDLAVEPFTDEELEALEPLPPGAPTSEQLVDEDRGAY